MMSDLSIIGTVIIIHLLATITPGANFIITVKNSLTYSRKTGFLTVVGVMIGNLIYIFSCLAGVAFVISKSVLIFNILKFFGAGYLGYLGIKSIASHGKIKINEEDKKKDISSPEAIKMGFLVLLSNPTAILFWIGLFTVVIPPRTAVFTLAVMISIMIINGFIWYCLVVLFFSQKELRLGYLKFQNYFNRAFGGILLYLAFRIFFLKK